MGTYKTNNNSLMTVSGNCSLYLGELSRPICIPITIPSLFTITIAVFPIAAGLGGGMFLLLVTILLLAVALICKRRKRNHQGNRYDTLVQSPECSIWLSTLHHSLLTFSIHYYSSAFTSTLQHSLLPFSIHYYPSSFTATLQCSLLPFSIHSYLSPFTAAILTTTLQHSLHSCCLFSIHCYIVCTVVHYCTVRKECVLLSDNSSQEAAATVSTSVWWHCWTASEHWECCVWHMQQQIYNLDHIQVILTRWFICLLQFLYNVQQHM